MTDAQLGRLPPILKEIVEVDRAIALERNGDSIDFKHLGDLRRRRRQLSAFCRGGWGERQGDDNTRPPAAAAARAA